MKETEKSSSHLSPKTPGDNESTRTARVGGRRAPSNDKRGEAGDSSGADSRKEQFAADARGSAARIDPLERSLSLAHGELMLVADRVTAFLKAAHEEDPNEPPTSERFYPSYNLMLQIFRQAERFSGLQIKLLAMKERLLEHAAKISGSI
jgi:hypothetical protein